MFAWGSTSPTIEAEQIAAVGEVFNGLRFAEFKIIVNHRGILTGLLDATDIAREQHETALVALDKLDKIGEQGVEAEFAARGIDPTKASRLMLMLRRVCFFAMIVPYATGREGSRRSY